MRRFVVNATDKNDFYSFFMPIVCHVWKAYMGYEPIAVLHGTEESWCDSPKNAFLLGHIKRAASIYFVADVPGFKVSTVMQLSRLFGHLLPGIDANDYLLTSDVDMVPLNNTYFNQQNTSCKFTFLGGDAYADLSKGHEPPKFPMCYMGARASSWRSVLETTTKDIQYEVASALRGRVDLWENDEMYFAEKLMSHPFYRGPWERIANLTYRRGECECIARTWHPLAHRRLDREAWFFDGEQDMIDCHAFRPGYQSKETLLRILIAYFPQSAGVFASYMEGFVSLKSLYG